MGVWRHGRLDVHNSTGRICGGWPSQPGLTTGLLLQFRCTVQVIGSDLAIAESRLGHDNDPDGRQEACISM